MKGRRAALVGLLAAPALLGACATKFEGAFNPTLFARASVAPDSRLPGRVALIVQVAVQGLVHEGDRTPARGVRLPLGRIAEEALLAALADTFQGGAVKLGEAPAADAGFSATLVLESVRIEHDDQLIWLLPLPVYPFLIGDRAIFARMVIELSQLDTQGRSLARRSHDSGRELYKRPTFWSNETLPDGLLRMAHESAWRLAQQAAVELREWVLVERNKARDL